ncbi:MAG: hypothetical protein EXX96DRAFT_616630 [Benjaminiella poitrasii]|nr:MAG: hypothetical protein EXX96DRAFT_616630 [Benjaminiella poitrasii]
MQPVVRDGNPLPRVIESAEGARTIPSVVAFTKEGETLAAVNPENSIYVTKDSAVQAEINTMSYKIAPYANGDTWDAESDRTCRDTIEMASRAKSAMSETEKAMEDFKEKIDTSEADK